MKRYKIRDKALFLLNRCFLEFFMFYICSTVVVAETNIDPSENTLGVIYTLYFFSAILKLFWENDSVTCATHSFTTIVEMEQRKSLVPIAEIKFFLTTAYWENSCFSTKLENKFFMFKGLAYSKIHIMLNLVFKFSFLCQIFVKNVGIGFCYTVVFCLLILFVVLLLGILKKSNHHNRIFKEKIFILNYLII